MVDLSRTGALVEPAHWPQPDAFAGLGERVSLFFRFVQGATQVPLTGTVVRLTATAFAVHFKHVDDRSSRLLVRLLPQLGERLEAWTPASAAVEDDSD